MDQLLLFFHQNTLLVSLFLATLLAIIVVEARRQGAGTFRISPAAVVRMMNHQEAVVIDLRDRSVYKKGHITGSLSIPWVDFSREESRLTKYKKRPIIFICQGGDLSVKALTRLRKLEFEQLHILSGGVSAWTNANMPMVSK